MDKIKSVIELSPYKEGDILFWVAFRPLAVKFNIKESDKWKRNVHPKIYYERKRAKKLWTVCDNVPKLHAEDFSILMTMLTSIPIVEEFIICDILRSNETGEYYYMNQDEEWMPQSNLFKTENEAEEEKTRILQLVSRWSRNGGKL